MRTLYFLFLSFFYGCLQENVPHAESLFYLMNPPPIFQVNVPDAKACVFTILDASGTRSDSYCFRLKGTDCKLSSLLDLPDTSILQGRKDDLSFLSLNYPVCNSGAGELNSIYSDLVPPTAMIFHRVSGSIGPIVLERVLTANVMSCKALGLGDDAGYIEGSDLKNLMGFTTDLFLQPETSSACRETFDIIPAFRAKLEEIRSGALLWGGFCSRGSGDTSPCSW